jgi:hypothetical protein
MVHDWIWAQTELAQDSGVLCLIDLAQRLGRPLRVKDFRATRLNRDIRRMIAAVVNQAEIKYWWLRPEYR